MESGNQTRSDLSRRAFGLSAVAAMLAGEARGADLMDAGASFSRDLARSFEMQIIGLDMEDVRTIFRDLRSPAVGMGAAVGIDGAAKAVRAALSDVGRLGPNVLAIIAFHPHQVRLRDLKFVTRTLCDEADPSASLVFGCCIDEDLPRGGLRVSLLTG